MDFGGLEGVKELVFSESRETEFPRDYDASELLDSGMVKMYEAMRKEGGLFHEEALEENGGDPGEDGWGFKELVLGITTNRRVEPQLRFFSSLGPNVVVKVPM